MDSLACHQMSAWRQCHVSNAQDSGGTKVCVCCEMSNLSNLEYYTESDGINKLFLYQSKHSTKNCFEQAYIRFQVLPQVKYSASHMSRCEKFTTDHDAVTCTIQHKGMTKNSSRKQCAKITVFIAVFQAGLPSTEMACISRFSTRYS